MGSTIRRRFGLDAGKQFTSSAFPYLRTSPTHLPGSGLPSPISLGKPLPPTCSGMDSISGPAGSFFALLM
jgi:hypothetical protein